MEVVTENCRKQGRDQLVIVGCSLPGVGGRELFTFVKATARRAGNGRRSHVNLAGGLTTIRWNKPWRTDSHRNDKGPGLSPRPLVIPPRFAIAAKRRRAGAFLGSFLARNELLAPAISMTKAPACRRGLW